MSKRTSGLRGGATALAISGVGTSLWTDTLPAHEKVSGSSGTVNEADAGTLGSSTDRALGHGDVVIVGAGYTGLWTAFEILQRDPSRRVTILERHHIGFGASGRNGGWCSAILPMSLERVAAQHGREAASRLQTEMHETVQRVVRFAAEHEIGDAVHRGGSIDIARNPAQVNRLRSHVAEMQHFGFAADDYNYVEADHARSWCNATEVLGGAITPHCAVVHPLRLVHALARAVMGAGGHIVEGVTVTGIESTTRGPRVTARREPHDHDGFTIDANVVIQATEAYSCELPGQRRNQLPIYSMMVATEPLSDAMWESIRLSDRPTFADGRNLIVYGQRTADGRLVFGGRGAPYHFGSRIEPRFDVNGEIAGRLQRSLIELFPDIAGVEFTHHWGGVLAAPRDWTCSVRFDKQTGIGSAGGYVGDGVATAALAGATLAELIVPGDRADLTALPIVGHQSRRWEVEPLRWLGVNTARFAAARADEAEQQQSHTARLWSAAMSSLLRR